MTNYVLWLDSEIAKIFALKPTGIEKSQVQKSSLDHHSGNKKDKHGDSHTEHFYRDLAVKLNDANQVLILGPGLAKNHFKTHFETHHNSQIAKKIIGLEACENITDNQILAEARKFFKHYDQFNNPI